MLTSDTSTQWLEIPQTVQTAAWQSSEFVAAPGDRWQVYLNQLCLQTMLPWLQEKAGIPAIETAACTPAHWERVTGSAVTIGNTRLVIIPIETMDRSEFRVPQEWVDIPAWIGDYYLAVEVEPDDQWIQVWGYTTHQLLKESDQSCFEADTRTYCVSGDAIIPDLTVFWVMQQLATEPTRSPVPALPTLSAVQTDALLQQLDRAIVPPRLQLPFPEWAALLEQPPTLQRLQQQRRAATSQPAAPSPVASNQTNLSQTNLSQTNLSQTNLSQTNLSQWLQNTFEAGWQTFEDFFGTQPDLAFSLRRGDAENDPTDALVRRVKRITPATDLPPVLLVLLLSLETDGRRKIGVRVLPFPGDPYLPANLQVALLTRSGEELQSVQGSERSNYIQLKRFRCPLGSPFQLKITVSNMTLTEHFIA